ncbi:MAG: CRISPR-associated endonuclease Cas3'' [Candidatus Methanosuratincola petrocarbonis]
MIKENNNNKAKSCGAFSYFKDNKPVELLEYHIKKGLEAIDLFSKRKYYLLLARQLQCDSEEARKVLYIAYIMHDVGKCIEEYQKGKKSFMGHEFYSAAVILKSELELDPRLKDIVALTVMLHHHTMPWRISKIDNRPVHICYEGKESVEKILNERIKLKVNLIEDISYVYDIVSELVSRARDRKLMEGVYALLIPVMVADDYAASVRGGNSCLGREAVNVVNIYRSILEES